MCAVFSSVYMELAQAGMPEYIAFTAPSIIITLVHAWEQQPCHRSKKATPGQGRVSSCQTIMNRKTPGIVTLLSFSSRLSPCLGFSVHVFILYVPLWGTVEQYPASEPVNWMAGH